ncbi:hypothetical protein HK103_000728 [Boothiomyces macroporosus]|uniref:Uncharacterized protein n=1 Tax=Boothiomyces macroporosus TaxID=261099 RepID=A0AAD5UF09_9FUNG|nr:hypothetical protein HK103_000728 [Boothiomyces macroporosus]
MNETPAHQFATNAEEYMEKGDLANACTAHFRAAGRNDLIKEQYLLAMNDTTDPEVSLINQQAVKTLKLLYASHTRNGKELQRRLNSPPTIRHQQSAPVITSKSSGKEERRISSEFGKGAVHLYSNPKRTQEKEPDMGSRQFFMGQPMESINLQAQNLSPMVNASVAQVPVENSELLNSELNSYLVLDQDAKEVKSDEDDPFDKFWDAVEGLVQKISGPVAFTTAPISKSDEHKFNVLDSTLPNSTFLNSYMIIPPNSKTKQDPHTNPAFTTNVRTKTLEEYQIENEQLKHTVDQLTKRVAELEKTQQENTMLRSSIIQFRQDVQKHRQLNQSIPPGRPQRSKLSMSVMPAVPTQPESTDVGGLQSRIKELEAQLKIVSEQHQQQLRKWEKLKETAKKKRESKLEQSEIEKGKSPRPFSPSEESMYYSVHSKN